MTRLILADDHPLYLEATHERLKRLLPAAEIVAATCLDEVRAAAGAEHRLPLRLLLLDYNMPGLGSPAGVAQVVAEIAQAPIAIVSGVATAEEVRRVIAAGARGFIPKTMPAAQFGAAIDMLLSGGTYMPVEIFNALIQGNAERHPVPAPSALDVKALDMKEHIGRLTPREFDVLKQVASGLSNKEIGRALSLAEITIKLHVRGLFRKLHLRSRSEAASIAARAGIA